MKLYAPKYYKKFRCIADRCEHSCCVGWEIDVDSDTLEKYKNLKGGYGAAIMDSISMEDTPHFVLGECDRCPHLDGQGLCKIIMNVGEDYLCDICREHPRFYNFTTVAEGGIGMSCPEAARIILSSADFAELEEVGESLAEPDDVCFDGRELRGKIYTVLQDVTCDYKTALEKIYRRYDICVGDDEGWLEKLESLEYLDARHKELFKKYSSKRRPDAEGAEDYLKRFLAYLIYRHCTEAIDAEDFGERLAFCLFCERLLASLMCSEGAVSLKDVGKLASIISEEIEYSDDNTYELMTQ